MSNTQFKKLNVTLTKEDYQRAKLFSDIQILCSNFLKTYNRPHKGSINFINNEIDHDYYIWYLSVMSFKRHLLQKNNIKIETWGDKFDTKRIINTINKKSLLKNDINYVYRYFCNKYHIKIQEKVYDIRTALTKLNPQSNWNFLFSVEKTKIRKNNVILLYCIGNKKHINKIIFSGTIPYKTIRQCSILKKGQPTIFGTINKINNYVTLLNKHYMY